MQQLLEVRLSLLSHPLFPTLPLLSKFLGKDARVVGKQVPFEEFGVRQILVDVVDEMRRAELVVGLPRDFDQTATVAVSIPVHDDANMGLNREIIFKKKKGNTRLV